jgi:hypothetical protein
VVGTQERQVALEVAAIEDLPERGGEEGLHATALQSHSEQYLGQGHRSK